MMPDLDKLSPDRKDWLEVFGWRVAPKKIMPGTCEACVWGSGNHSSECPHAEPPIYGIYV